MTTPRPFPSAARCRAFTVAEMVVAMAASTMVFGSLILTMTSLSRSFDATEKYSRAQAAQIRLIDSMGMDLRRAVGISVTTSATSNPAATGNTSVKFSYSSTNAAANTCAITDGTYDSVNNRTRALTGASTYLTFTLPGYYQSNDPASSSYRNATNLISTGRAVRYGTSSAVAGHITVQYRRAYHSTYGKECFVRREDGVDRVILEDAGLINASVVAQSDGTFVISDTITPTFSSRTGATTIREMSSDRVMLRNPRLD